MMVEWIDEYFLMFEENKEVVYFFFKEEFLEKCKYYLVYDFECKLIVLVGCKRCIILGYSNEGMICFVFKFIYNKKG